MHTTTKDVVGNEVDAKFLNVPVGAHIVTTVIEGDGPVALCSAEAKLSARVLHVTRTDSGGMEVQVAVLVSEPAPAIVTPPTPAPAPPIPQEQAVSYFTSKGMSIETAKAKVEEFGVARVLAAREKELDNELAKVVAGN
jgi:hypothetical protein